MRIIYSIAQEDEEEEEERSAALSTHPTRYLYVRGTHPRTGWLIRTALNNVQVCVNDDPLLIRTARHERRFNGADGWMPSRGNPSVRHPARRNRLNGSWPYTKHYASIIVIAYSF